MPPQLSIHALECFLEWCRKHRSHDAFRSHVCLCRHGFEMHPRLGNHLVCILAGARLIDDATRVFDSLPHKALRAWNSLINGRLECGSPLDALVAAYRGMLDDASVPNGHTFVALLRALTELNDLEAGYRIHREIGMKGLLESDLYVGSCLLRMYAEWGLLEEAQHVFRTIPCRNTVLWNTLIGGYARWDRGEDALYYLHQMQDPPDSITFVCGLKACGSTRNIDAGERIHAQIMRNGMLERNRFLRSALIDMYAKCGLLAKAHEVFDGLPDRDVISWTALISGYVLHGCCGAALRSLELMELECVSPTIPTYACGLKACGNAGAIENGMKLHEEIVRRGLARGEPVLGNTLVDMYARCGLLEIALEVLDELPSRDAVPWNALIAGFVDRDAAEEALDCIRAMQTDGVSPDAVTFVSGLKACCGIGSPEEGREAHAAIVRFGLLDADLALENALIDMYGKCGCLAEAARVFEAARSRDVVSWTTIMAAYCEHGRSSKALASLERMLVEGVLPNSAAFLCGLRACRDSADAWKGRIVHAVIVGNGPMPESEVALAEALIGLYSEAGEFSESKAVFERLPAPSKSSWNALLAGFARHAHRGADAVACFRTMRAEGFEPDHVAFTHCSKACGALGDSGIAADLHAEVSRRGLLGANAAVGNAVIWMCGKCGLPQRAREVFESLGCDRDAVSWACLMSGCAGEDRASDALSCYRRMRLEGVLPNDAALVHGLKACGDSMAAAQGDEIHAEIVKRGSLERHPGVANALIRMYAKSGGTAEAREVLDRLPARNTLLWNALISGHARCARGLAAAAECFEEMQAQGFSPDHVTFLGLLSACGHAGLLDPSRLYLGAMTELCGLLPMQEHYACALDSLARAGSLDEAGRCGMPVDTRRSVVRRSLIAACRSWGNVELGTRAFLRPTLRDRRRQELA